MSRKRPTTSKRHVVIKSAKGHVHAHVPLKSVPGLEKFRLEMERGRRTKEKVDLAESLDFQRWFISQPPLTFGPDVTWADPVFRLMYGGAPPLSILGSFGAGGRFNAGMAQMSAHFPSLPPKGCLYVASTLECCYAEAQPPYGSPQQFSLSPNRDFKLWNMQKVLQHYADPLLDQRILNSPYDANWKYQKIPMTSQLLVAELRKIGGDGVIMSSTKRPKDSNIAIFFESDEDCTVAIAATLLSSDEYPIPVP